MSLVLLVLLAMLGLVACGDDGGDAEAEPAEGGSASEAAADVDPTATLRFAHYLGVDKWDPHQSLGGPNIPLLGLVYDTLVHLTADGQAEPGLATSWEFDEDATTLTMELREGVTFTDGEPFDAEVVKANLERAKSHPKATVSSLLASVSAVEVVDETTVRLSLSEPNTALPLTLAERPGMMISPALLEQELIEMPVGSGMFAVTASELGQSASFEKNEDYWDAEVVKVAGLEMEVMSDTTTRLNALISGSIDLAELDTSMLGQIESRGLQAVTGPDLRLYALEVNPDVVPELADERVRLAVSLAIDREAIVEGIFFGHGNPLDQPFPKGSTAYDEDLEGAFARDVDRAKELLAEAGLADGFAFDMVVGTDPAQGQVAEAMQAQLAEIGVRIRVEKLSGFGPGQAYWNDKTVGAAMFRITARYAHQSTIEAWYTEGVQANPGNVTNQKVLDLLAESMAEADEDAVIDLMHEVSAELAEHPLGVIPIVQAPLVVAAKPDVQGLAVWLSGFPALAGVGVAK